MHGLILFMVGVVQLLRYLNTLFRTPSYLSHLISVRRREGRGAMIECFAASELDVNSN